MHRQRLEPDEIIKRRFARTMIGRWAKARGLTPAELATLKASMNGGAVRTLAGACGMTAAEFNRTRDSALAKLDERERDAFEDAAAMFNRLRRENRVSFVQASCVQAII